MEFRNKWKKTFKAKKKSLYIIFFYKTETYISFQRTITEQRKAIYKENKSIYQSWTKFREFLRPWLQFSLD